jgi:thiamine thiazole synthase
METLISRAITGGFFSKLDASMELDVAVVGAGPSGLMAALRLAQARKRVAIFERKLAPGGGIWGGAMLFNEVVFQPALAGLLSELGIRTERVQGDLLRADAVEVASALIYHTVHAGAVLFNAVTVEDVVFKNSRVAGVVVNWTPVNLEHMHVDPLVICSKIVLDSGGHHAELTAQVARKAGIKLATPTGGIMGEKPMWAEEGERTTIENTGQVYPGLYVSGMAVNGVYGSFRMGPIFGGMLLSGEKAATLMIEELGRA